LPISVSDAPQVANFPNKRSNGLPNFDFFAQIISFAIPKKCPNYMGFLSFSQGH
jgi:hypothetical protein